MMRTNQQSRLFCGFILVCAACQLMSSVSYGQSTLATLEGIITDPEKNGLPGTAIIARNMETGYEYNCLSRPDGRYIIAGIDPGKYEVRAALPGFVTQTKQGLIFNVGAILKIDFQLAVATLKEEVVVTASAPMVEVVKSEISSVVDRRAIDDLPLLDRNYISLSLTKPGYQEKGDGTSNAQPYGSEEMLVDGVSNEWVGTNSGRSLFPADAIEEFRVITNQYQVEFGNSSGMIRAAITRSGTNTLRGRVSFFSRDEAFDDVNYFVNHNEYQGPELPKEEWQKAPYEHYRFAGFLGGPIKKDKAHFFLAYEGLRRTEYSTITSPLVPKETVDVGTNLHMVLLKLNFQPNEKNLFSSRLSLGGAKYTNSGVGGYYTRERAYDYEAFVPEFQANWTFFASADAINELRLLYAKTVNEHTVAMPGSYSIKRPLGFFGKPPSYPHKTIEDRYQLVDNFSLFLGSHSLKIGLDFSSIPRSTHQEIYIPGEFTFTTYKPFDPADPSTYPYYFYYNSSGFSGLDYSYREMGIFAQDSWRVHARLTLNLGLRWNYFFWEYFDINHSDIRNLNPRLGLSWDPFGDGRTAVRAGVGTFSKNPPANLTFQIGAASRRELRTIYYPGYPDPFQPNPFVPSIPYSSPPETYESGKDMVPPFTVQTTLGFERELFKDFSAAVDLVWSKGQHYTRSEDENPIIPGTGYVRKDPAKGARWVLTDHGKTDYRALYLVLNKRYSHNWSLEVAYTLSRSWADVEWGTSAPYSYEDDAWDRMYGPIDIDALHRLAVTGIVDLPWGFQVSGQFYYRSALPWNALYATDVNKDGLVTDMVDEHRNSRRGFDYFQLNTRVSYHLKLGRFVFQVFAEAYNLTNRTNFTTIYSKYGSDLFGKPTAADIPRQIQLGARIDF
jgi:hypothetical protein